MAQDSDVEERMLELDELHARLALVETQLAAARVQRLAGPGGGLFFAGLALMLFGDEIRSAAPGSLQFFWIVLFVAGCALGAIWNELRSRRSILHLGTERDRLSKALKAQGP